MHIHINYKSEPGLQADQLARLFTEKLLKRLNADRGTWSSQAPASAICEAMNNI